LHVSLAAVGDAVSYSLNAKDQRSGWFDQPEGPLLYIQTSSLYSSSWMCTFADTTTVN